MRILGLRQALLLCSLTVCLSGCQFLSGGNETIHPAASLPKTTPWDLAALSKAPSVKWLGKGKISSLIYQGMPYKGKPTSVFAYYATPGSISGDPSKDKDLPAVVLVHGGGRGVLIRNGLNFGPGAGMQPFLWTYPVAGRMWIWNNLK